MSDDLPKYERFVPGNRRSMRHWAIGILVFQIALWSFVQTGFFVWWVAILVTVSMFGAFAVLRAIRASIAAKLDPYKGTAPRDKVPPYP